MTMTEIEAVYNGNKRCTLTHPTGLSLQTDVPDDEAEPVAFGPTELVASGLVTCILTTIALFAERRAIPLPGLSARVGKEMGGTPRRIARLPVTVTLPASVAPDMRPLLERVGRACPVHHSLHPDIDAPIEYIHK